MKVAIAQFPVLGEIQPKSVSHVAKPQAKSAVATKATAASAKVAHLCKLAVVLSGSAMIYCLVSYGRIFENYLQW
jgi:hypothetical protein